MSPSPEAAVTVLLKRQRDRQKIVDELLERPTWSRYSTWLPTALTLAFMAGWNAWPDSASHATLLIALLTSLLVGISISQAQAARRLKAITIILDRSGALDQFIFADSPALVARSSEHP